MTERRGDCRLCSLAVAAPTGAKFEDGGAFESVYFLAGRLKFFDVDLHLIRIMRVDD